MSNLNLTLMTDLYEFTMMQGYFKNQSTETVVFDVFYRSNPSDGGYSITAGLEQVIDYIKNLRFHEEDISYLRSLNIFDEDFLEYLRDFRFSGDIYAIPEGTVVFPKEPLITSKDCPAFGGVYKLAAIQNKDGEFIPKIKLSENTAKVTNPGIYNYFKKICFAKPH